MSRSWHWLPANEVPVRPGPSASGRCHNNRLCALGVLASIAFLAGSPPVQALSLAAEMIVSVPEQKLAVIDRGKLIARFPVSTSKFGVGDQPGSYQTPLGTLFVSGRFGDDLPAGAVIKSRMPTGEIVNPNAPGRDAIVSRVIWLRGKEFGNRYAHDRCIYIHGTPEEKRIGRPASFGCIRMRSKDVIALYQCAHVGMHVTITQKRISDFVGQYEEPFVARAD